jgi:hypothetical protein
MWGAGSSDRPPPPLARATGAGSSDRPPPPSRALRAQDRLTALPPLARATGAGSSDRPPPPSRARSAPSTHPSARGQSLFPCHCGCSTGVARRCWHANPRVAVRALRLHVCAVAGRAALPVALGVRSTRGPGPWPWPTPAQTPISPSSTSPPARFVACVRPGVRTVSLRMLRGLAHSCWGQDLEGYEGHGAPPRAACSRLRGPTLAHVCVRVRACMLPTFLAPPLPPLQTPELDGKHVVFGRVVSGLDVVLGLDKHGTPDRCACFCCPHTVLVTLPWGHRAHGHGSARTLSHTRSTHLGCCAPTCTHALPPTPLSHTQTRLQPHQALGWAHDAFGELGLVGSAPAWRASKSRLGVYGAGA